MNKPTTWKEVCNVIYSDKKIFNIPYMSTEFSAQLGTRGTAYGFSDFALTNDTLDIATPYLVPVYIDRADLAQMTLQTVADVAERQGAMLDEQLETAFLANHAAWTNFTNASIGGVAGNITVSLSNINDIITGVKREVIEANGLDMMKKYGLAFVWRAADFEILEQYMQANGYNLADAALKNGIMTDQGYYAFGAYHYVSNNHTSGHVFAGVRKIETIGILRNTYGQIVLTEDPNLQSGKGIIARVDYGINTPAAHTGIVFDVTVA